MLVLDTDHLSELERSSPAGLRLASRLDADIGEKAITIIIIEEQMRGWLAQLNRSQNPHSQISPYSKLQRQIQLFAEWFVLFWDANCADQFLSLHKMESESAQWI